MKLKDALLKLQAGAHPVATIMANDEHLKVYTILFKAGMVMSDHKTANNAILYVLDGDVIYHDAANDVEINYFEEYHIQPGVVHSITAKTDATCLLIQTR
jgi:quercetin dioxygenase-like cupin family protein